MINPRLLRSCLQSHKSRGAALIIVLGFVVLLSVLALAFLSSATLNRQVSKASAGLNQAKLFGQGAIDAIVGDLRQEIKDGTPGANTFTFPPSNYANGVPITVYLPQTGLKNTVMPAIATHFGAPPTNLIKESDYGIKFYSGENGYAQDGPERASSISTATPSQNGHYFTPARWNQPLLMQANSTVDLTPVGWKATDCPNWILVGRDGSNPLSPNSAAAVSDLGDPTKVDYIVGRYAYTIYDEGSLLDANVAGFPGSGGAGTVPSPMPAVVVTTTASSTPATLTEQQVGPKTAASFADLTQIGLSPKDIDALVGWRNHASAHPIGTFPSYSFGAASISDYFGAVLANNNGFATLGDTSLLNPPPAPPPSNPEADRAFPTRQAFIQFMMQTVAQVNGDAASVQDALQYLGTYTRDVNQPSYWPNPKRPRITNTVPWVPATANSPSPANPTSNYTNYYGNNDQAGNDDNVNPPFLSIRVGEKSGDPAFTRFDGTLAQSGDPLVSKRFPLCRLAWLTYLGPSAPKSTMISGLDPTYLAITKQGVGQATLNNGTINNIYACFGLTWTTPQGYGAGVYTNEVKKCWVYSHVDPSPPSGTVPAAGHIKTLAEVATAGREPDFFELLKAAICTGSLGKGAASSEKVSNAAAKVPAYEGIYQHTMDTITDYQIIQIGANIIDQFDADGYPTWIQIDTNSYYGVKDCFGVENLPYLLGLISTQVQVNPPIPEPRDDNVAQTREVSPPVSKTSPPPPVPGAPLPGYLTANGALTSNGLGIAMVNPIIWNIHDAASSPGVPAPTQIIVTGDSNDPGDTANNTSSALYSNYYLSLGDNSTTGYGAGFDQYSCNANGGQTASQFSDSTITYMDTVKNKLITYNGNYIRNQIQAADSSGNPIINYLTPKTSELDVNLLSTTSSSAPYHEPTVLLHVGAAGLLPMTSANALDLGSSSPLKKWDGITLSLSMSSIPDCEAKGDPAVAGMFVGSFPMRITQLDPITGNTNPKKGDPTKYEFTVAGYTAQSNLPSTPQSSATFRMAYLSPLGGYQTYDQKYAGNFANDTGYMINNTNAGAAPDGIKGYPDNWEYDAKGLISFFEPRSPRFGNSWSPENQWYGVKKVPIGGGTSKFTKNSPSPFPSDVLGSPRPTSGLDNWGSSNQGNPGRAFGNKVTAGDLAQIKWSVYAGNGDQAWHGYFAQNNPYIISANGKLYYEDPDSVVRRGMDAYGTSGNDSTTLGMPTATAYLNPLASDPIYVNGSSNSGATVPTTQSRPVMLNRPFRSVADLGYVFRDEPFKNIDFFTPESGDSALLDVFCIDEDNRPDGLVAGKVNLNTRQPKVLQAILSGAVRDETQANGAAEYPLGGIIASELTNVAQLLINRTTSKSGAAVNTGQLANIGDLVGKFVVGYNNPQFTQIDPTVANIGDYDGFTNDLFNYAAYSGGAKTANNMIQRYLESAIRALADVGTTRTWNLLIDVVAQTGRYPLNAMPSAATDHFVIDGEQRYWVHVAIDRYTGQVVDESVELVKQ